jgi:UDP-3-O-[3-hydroxymyristoyl] glucosamine N-acyltransferase
MNLSEYFDKQSIIRNGTFIKTMFPKTSEPYSICYAMQQFHLEVALSNQNISAIITTKELSSLVDKARGLVVVENPKLSYYQLHNFLVEKNLIPIHTEHFVHPTSQIAPTAIIGNHVVIGEGVIINHGAIINDYTVIGTGTYIGENVVISVRGMQDTYVNGEFFPIQYAGGVKIGSKCEVLSGAIIQKPYHAYYTEIGDDSKISVKVVVGHGVKIGRGTMVAGNTQIAGNVVIGEHVWIGPSTTIADGVTIGDYAQVKIGSVVIEDVEHDQQVSGNFAVDHKRQLRIHAKIKNGQF